MQYYQVAMNDSWRWAKVDFFVEHAHHPWSSLLYSTIVLYDTGYNSEQNAFAIQLYSFLLRILGSIKKRSVHVCCVKNLYFLQIFNLALLEPSSTVW